MKYFLVLILSISILSGCAGRGISEGIVEIVGVDSGIQVVRGMGVCISPDAILTSAHVVRDDRMNYELRMSNYGGVYTGATGIERYTETDIAFLKVGNVCNEYKKYIGKVNVRVGQGISIPVMRSGSTLILTGTITSLTGTVLAYDHMGRTELMTGVLVTDVDVLPGDSGAPILDGEGRVVDVVHTK